MVKGVNKQIIEVNNPDSIYFEKAIFYLRPGVRILPTELSSREIDKITAPYGNFRRKKNRLRLGRTVIYVLIIMLIAALIFFISR